jgi:hypothetical protein
MASVTLTIGGKASSGSESEIHKALDKIVIELRAKALKEAAKKAGKIAESRARILAPRGDKKHKPKLKPLASTIKTKVKQYAGQSIAVAIVGPTRPEGAHGHLVERGHEIRGRGKAGGGSPGEWTGARVDGKEFLAPAVDQTQSQQEAAILDVFRKAAEQEGTVRL